VWESLHVRARVEIALALATALALVATGTIALAASATGAASVSCPLKPGSGAGSNWAFSQSGPPRNRAGRLISTYTHGRGNLSNGQASGTTCLTEHARHLADQTLVLTVQGAAQLNRPTTINGVLGAQLVLAVRVKRSEDPSCKHGAGKLTLFSSYNGAHLDSVSLRLGGRCARHNHDAVNGGADHVVVSISY
jgi:hypothetical protein